MTSQTETTILAEGGKVVIRHSQPVGTQWMPPAQARAYAEAILEYAAVAESQARHEEN